MSSESAASPSFCVSLGCRMLKTQNCTGCRNTFCSLSPECKSPLSLLVAELVPKSSFCKSRSLPLKPRNACRFHELFLNAQDLLCHSILLVSVGVMDELPVQLLGLLRVKLLTAFCTLKACTHLDANVLGGAITRLCRIANLHGLWHSYT